VSQPPFGTQNVSDATSSEPASFDAGNVAVNISDATSSEPASFDAGNVAVNISDAVVVE
jgi:hypothetical protein